MQYDPDDFVYTESRLVDSIVTINGHPSIVYGISSEYVHHQPLGDGFEEDNAKLSEVDVNPVHIGFVNKLSMACYYSRIPAKQYKQGLTQMNLYNVSKGTFDLSYIKNTAGFISAYKSIYPTLAECVGLIKAGTCASKAFDKEFALKASANPDAMQVMAREGVIGEYIIPTHTFNLYEDFEIYEDDLKGVL